MTEVTVMTRSGEEVSVPFNPGETLMEAIRNAGIDELMALCGGACSCATCHVFVDASGAGDLPPVSEDEDDLLDSSEYRRPESRLSCQLLLADGWKNVRVTIAPED